jgi:two-component system, chemotaxis family, sensor kinase CheA
LPSLMVCMNEDVFAVPLESVAEIVRVSSEDIKTVHGLPTARVRDKTISVVMIQELLSWGHMHFRSVSDASEDTTLVILDEEGLQFGLVVDEVLGEEDVVIKSIAQNYRNIPGVTGASIRGNGRVSLILDPPALFTMLSRGNAALVSSQENTL